MQSIICILFAGSAMAHMALTNPAPRRSPNHPGYKQSQYDYDLRSPLGGGFTFPCRGAKPGPVYKSYQAGSNIDVHIGGNTKHQGGHCQFALSYDDKSFAVVKTVMGNCITGTVDYQVPIPASAANGKATLAWTWINREGNREYYMNCVDIEITGGKSSGGSISGKNLLVADLPGYKIFPEGFSDTYGQELFDAQPIITVSPSGSGTVSDPKPNPEPTSEKPKPETTSDKPSPIPKPETTSDKPSPMPKPTSDKPSSMPKPTSDKPSPMPTSDSKPEPTPVGPKPQSGKCQDGSMYCQGNSIAMCFMNQLHATPCADGTQCKGSAGQAQCM